MILGRLTLKNIERPIHAFSVKWERCRIGNSGDVRVTSQRKRMLTIAGSCTGESARQAFQLPFCPSTNLSGDPE